MKNLLLNKIVFLIFLVWSNLANAGLIALTIHSRANCGNNESITWWAGHPLDLETVSIHSRSRSGNLLPEVHAAIASREQTWRSAAIHWGEASIGAGWSVEGDHYIYRNGKIELLGVTYVTDCSIYDGWWD